VQIATGLPRPQRRFVRTPSRSARTSSRPPGPPFVVPADAERDLRVGMPEPAADRQDADAGGCQVRRLRVEHQIDAPPGEDASAQPVIGGARAAIGLWRRLLFIR